MGELEKGIAKWNHIIQFYELDNANPNYAFAARLKQEHLNPNTKQNMKVQLAVQVLSHTVSTGMYARIGKGLPAEAIVTADMISEMDNIFDALNSDIPNQHMFLTDFKKWRRLSIRRGMQRRNTSAR